MKGTMNKVMRERMYSAQVRLKRALNKRHRDKESRELALIFLDDLKRLKKEYTSHMQLLPKRFGPNYSTMEYFLDRHNVRLYFSHWEREDWWEAKKKS